MSLLDIANNIQKFLHNSADAVAHIPQQFQAAPQAAQQAVSNIKISAPKVNFSQPVQNAADWLNNGPTAPFTQSVRGFGETLGKAAAAPSIIHQYQDMDKNSNFQAQMLEQKAKATSDPELKKRYYKMAQSIYEDSSKRWDGVLKDYNKSGWDIGKEALGTFGTLYKPAQVAGGGVVGGGIKIVENAVTGKPLTQDLNKGVESGATLGAQLAPLSAATNAVLGPYLDKVLPKLPGNINTYLNAVKGLSPEARGAAYQIIAKRIGLDLARNAVTGGVPFAIIGGLQPAKDNKERAMNAIKSGAQGAVFQAGIRGVGIGASALKGQVLDNIQPGLTTKTVDLTQQDLFESPPVQRALANFKKGNSEQVNALFDKQLAKAQVSGDYRGPLSMLQNSMDKGTKEAVNTYLTEIADTNGGTIAKGSQIAQGGPKPLGQQPPEVQNLLDEINNQSGKINLGAEISNPLIPEKTGVSVNDIQDAYRMGQISKEEEKMLMDNLKSDTLKTLEMPPASGSKDPFIKGLEDDQAKAAQTLPQGPSVSSAQDIRTAFQSGRISADEAQALAEDAGVAPDKLFEDSIIHKVGQGEPTITPQEDAPSGIKKHVNDVFKPFNNATPSTRTALTEWRSKVLQGKAQANMVADDLAGVDDETAWKLARYAQNPTEADCQTSRLICLRHPRLSPLFGPIKGYPRYGEESSS
jgi:hypothetical protein